MSGDELTAQTLYLGSYGESKQETRREGLPLLLADNNKVLKAVKLDSMKRVETR